MVSDSPQFALTDSNRQTVGYFPRHIESIGAEINVPSGVRTTSVSNIDATQNVEVGLTLNYATSQAVSFSTPAPSNPNVGSIYNVSAMASSGLPVSFSIDHTSWKGVCTLGGSRVSFTAAGLCGGTQL
jgi:hypothetical protein